MSASAILLYGMMLAALPVGWASGIAARRITGGEPLLSVIVGFDIAVVYWAWVAMPPIHFLFLATCVLGWLLVANATCDVLVFRLPDIFTYPLIAAGFAVALGFNDGRLADQLIGAVAGFAILAALAWVYERLRHRQGLGLGDAKLAAAAGAWLGWQALPSVILVAATAGIAWAGVAYLLRGRTGLDERVPFGVPLALAFWLTWLYGPLTIGL